MRAGKENDLPSPISLDFKKKSERPRPSTDRTSLGNSAVKTNGGQETLSLLEKKKQYSLALREKNLSKKGREDS